MRVIMARYQQRNKEILSQKAKERYHRNREMILDKMKAYREANPDYIKQYRAKNREILKKKSLDYYYKHKVYKPKKPKKPKEVKAVKPMKVKPVKPMKVKSTLSYYEQNKEKHKEKCLKRYYKTKGYDQEEVSKEREIIFNNLTEKDLILEF